MIPVVLKYKYWLIPRTKKIELPTRWEELSAKQFLIVARNMEKQIDGIEFFRSFFGLSTEELNRLDGFQIFKLSSLIDFILDITTGCNTWLIKSIGKRLAPGAALAGVTLHQWMVADTYFSKYFSLNKEELLNYAIAALYLPKGYGFSGEKLVDLDAAAKEVAATDELTKKAIVLNFTLIRCWLSKSYPFLFPTSSTENKGTPGATNWLEIFDSLVDGKLTEIDEYKKVSVIDAFRNMNRRIKEYNDDKAKHH